MGHMNTLHLNIYHLLSISPYNHIIIYNVTYIQVVNPVNLLTENKLLDAALYFFSGRIETFGSETILYLR